MAASSSVSPYQFQPSRDSHSESDDDSAEYQTEEEFDVENKCERKDMEAQEWCKCGNCQKQFMTIECVCCQEIDETNLILKKAGIGMYAYDWD